MFAKILMIILAAGGIAIGLLVQRQERLDLVHDMSKVHQRIVEHDRALWAMQADIARRCRPQEIRAAIGRLGGEWLPIPSELPDLNQPHISPDGFGRPQESDSGFLTGETTHDADVAYGG